MGASGMGQAIAELLAGRGAQVTVLDREGCQSQKHSVSAVSVLRYIFA